MNANNHREPRFARRRALAGVSAFAAVLVVALTAAGDVAHASAGASSAKAPRVLQVTPASGSENVDPALKVMEIRFDRPMEPGYSLVGIRAEYPEAEGEPRWNQDRTVLHIPVRLEPGKQYKMSLNGGRFHNFRSAEGEPLVPVPWTFSTAQGKLAR